MKRRPDEVNDNDVSLVIDHEKNNEMAVLTDRIAEVLGNQGFNWSRAAGKYDHYLVYKSIASPFANIMLRATDDCVVVIIRPQKLAKKLGSAMERAGLKINSRGESIVTDDVTLNIVAGNNDADSTRFHAEDTKRSLVGAIGRWFLGKRF